MDLGRVVGTIVASRKESALEGTQLCIIQPVNEKLEPAAAMLIATEASSGRCSGDLVYYVESGDAVYTHPDGRELPVDAAIVGLVDAMHLPKPRRPENGRAKEPRS
jgi:ethanolamine utilization protein EutN